MQFDVIPCAYFNHFDVHIKVKRNNEKQHEAKLQCCVAKMLKEFDRCEVMKNKN